MFTALVHLLVLGLLLPLVSGDNNILAADVSIKSDNVLKHRTVKQNIDSCTERCHVNYMAYKNEFDSSKEKEVFKHETHSLEQGLDCISCHDDKEVNTKGHGELTINHKNCLKCHHVEVKDSQCKSCHTGIDTNPMKYKKEKFLHGFTVDSDVDCALCHIKDPQASMKEKINCVKCHHTTPDLDCVKCHKEDIKQTFNTDLQQKDDLLWTVTFDHSQHPDQDISCKKCHAVTEENDAGIVKYNLNCSKCHHASEEEKECNKCHEAPSAYLKGIMNAEWIDAMPDMMSRAVKCEDCHKFNEKDLKFKDVKDACIKCHNDHYGTLHDAWRNVIKNRLDVFNKRIIAMYEDEETIRGPDFNAFLEKTGEVINLIKKYGIHNFNMTRSVLDYLENKTDDIMYLDSNR